MMRVGIFKAERPGSLPAFLLSFLVLAIFDQVVHHARIGER